MLYIYSGEVPELDHRLRQMLAPRPAVTIIPCSLTDRAAARQVAEHLRHTGFRARLPGTRFFRDPVRLRHIIMNSAAIYLMGGNTFEFLAYAQSIGLFALVAEFESAGGVIAAESAGSIILSPNIATALIPTTCPDEQHHELEDYRGMGRIPFHVSPHYLPGADEAEQELAELQALADYSACPVLVLQDGEGVVLERNRIVTTVGRPLSLEPVASAAQQRASRLPDWADRLAGDTGRVGAPGLLIPTAP